MGSGSSWRLALALAGLTVLPGVAVAQEAWWSAEGEGVLPAYDEAEAYAAPDEYLGEPDVDGEVTLESFYASLSPHGEWLDTPDHGRVWRPHVAQVGADFYPYGTGGHWVNTRWGWQFASSYPWSWAAFHYGRWVLDSYRGWLWVPDTVWGPAWVRWRWGGAYVGWAPLPPARVVAYVDVTPRAWCFVPHSRFAVRSVYRYRLAEPSAWTVFRQTRLVEHRHGPGARWFGGPRPAHPSFVRHAPSRAGWRRPALASHSAGVHAQVASPPVQRQNGYGHPAHGRWSERAEPHGRWESHQRGSRPEERPGRDPRWERDHRAEHRQDAQRAPRSGPPFERRDGHAERPSREAGHRGGHGRGR